MEWPGWWTWELEISSHCAKRMLDRLFNETDIRAMLQDAVGMSEQAHGTFIVQTLLDSTPWEVVVVPDDQKQVIVVVTAYPNE